MALASDAGSTRSRIAETFDLAAGRRRELPFEDDPPPARDLKKLVLITGLGILSWVATYVGMLELVEANMGELPLVHKVIIGFSVGMLMVMIVWLLDQMFAPLPAFTKFCYVVGYVFLTLISVGFGFGFYWKVLESRSEASRSAESAVSQVQDALHAAATRLDQLQGTLVKLSDVSTEKAEIERTKGTSCPNSRPGDGPRRKMREDDAARFSFASDFVKGRAGAVKTEITALDADLVRIASADPATLDAKTGTRNEFMKALSRKLDMTVTGFNAFRTDPQLRQLRTELADRAEQSTFGEPRKGGFVCPDAQLQGALRGAVKAIDQLPELDRPKIAAVEGSEATIEAFRRLTATVFGLIALKMPPSADELRDLQHKAVQSVEGGAAAHPNDPGAASLSRRDYIPLAVALFVDLCLLLVSMGRPVNRLGGLLPRMREAERSPVSHILSRFSDIHRDAGVRQTFEVFRHVVFDQGGVYYVAVPLDAPYHMAPNGAGQRFGYGTEEASELQHEAHLLANLFTSFEKERIFARVYSPLLSTRMVQKKLARQGSKFAGCQAFRVYRFRDGAWPEIILGAVMGAARRAEQHRADAARDVTTSAETLDRPSHRHDRSAHEREPIVTGLRDERATAPRTMFGDRPAGPPASAESRLAADYGPYARGAAADLAASPEAEVDVKAASSNTVPSPRPGPPLEERTGPDIPEPPASTVVALPRRVRPPAPMQPQPPSQSPPESQSLTPAPASEGTVDVMMRRETASFRVPVSAAMLPAALLEASGKLATAVVAAPLESDLHAPIPEIARALEALTDDLTETPLDSDFHDCGDFDADGAARLAVRLRPALPVS